jgi:hypothetical protein
MAGCAAILFAFMVVPAAPAPTQTPPDWGKADASGVQIRLQAVKRVRPSTETPSLTLDLRNTGSKTALYFGLGQECLIEVDGHWYAWSEPISINMPARQLFPGKEKDGAVTVELTAVWFTRSDVPDWDGESAGDIKGITQLKLSPGKHTVRVKFPFEFESTEKPVKVISNPVEIEVEAASSATSALQH